VGEYGFDACLEKAEVPTDKAVTVHGCKCAFGGWKFQYGEDLLKFDGCANPDGDPLGPWCGINPQDCDEFAGILVQDGRVSVLQIVQNA
jgi:hypothetical protein